MSRSTVLLIVIYSGEATVWLPSLGELVEGLYGVIHHMDERERGELRWHDVPVRAYGPENSGADGTTRQILIGNEEDALKAIIVAGE